MTRLRINGLDIHLGYFRDKIEAINARKTMEKNYGFHRNHGAEKHAI